jgi:enamine deaminase RidA (YjgF/YER057c/UK114 family)
MQIPIANNRIAVIPAAWVDFYESTHIPAAIRIGDTLRLTGHTGDATDGSFSSDPTEQIRQTFENIAQTLQEAGSGWADVVEITSFHIGLRDQADALLAIARELLPTPHPAWSAIGVAELFEPDALIEISCVAVLGSD